LQVLILLENRSLARLPACSLRMTPSPDRPDARGVKTERGCHFIRNKGNWEIGKLGRVNFWRVLCLRTIDCYMRDPSLRFVARDDHPGRMVIFFARIDKTAVSSGRMMPALQNWNSPGSSQPHGGQTPRVHPKRYVYFTASVKPVENRGKKR
jgi:hypothetical protein